MMSCPQVVTSLLFFQFMAHLEHSESWILDAQSVKLTFPIIETFYLTKTENRTKKPLTQLSHYCFEERYYFYKKMSMLKMLTSAKLRGIWYEEVYF